MTDRPIPSYPKDPEPHDCGYPPGDTVLGKWSLTRRCSECGQVWRCIHPRLGWWQRDEDLNAQVSEV